MQVENRFVNETRQAAKIILNDVVFTSDLLSLASLLTIPHIQFAAPRMRNRAGILNKREK